MIQANLTITTLRRACMVVPIALAGIVVLIALYFATALSFNYSYSFSLIAYLFLILAGGLITLGITITQGRYWQRIEQRRFAAVQGEQTLLAAEQPTPNAASLQLPITIKLGYRKESLPGLEPTILPDEYNRQMEALLSLVAAKTGLALYDLSGVRS